MVARREPEETTRANFADRTAAVPVLWRSARVRLAILRVELDGAMARVLVLLRRKGRLYVEGRRIASRCGGGVEHARGGAGVMARPPACQIGPTHCHGPMAWCDDCGDVGEVCDGHGHCDCHTCPSCGALALIRDYACEDCHERERWELKRAAYVSVHGTEEEKAEQRMLQHPNYVVFADDFAWCGRITRPRHAGSIT